MEMLTWSSDDGYVQYKIALSDLMKRLGLGAVDYYVRPELAPYITKILEYLDKKLVLLGDDADIKEKLQLVFDTFDYGADLIVDLKAIKLAKEVGVSEGFLFVYPKYQEEEEVDSDDIDGGVLGEEEDTENEEGDTEEVVVEYSQDRFIFTWTNVMSCLVTRLKLMYASLLIETTPTGCPCCCGSTGETWKDWESWTSGVYPEDEEYRNEYNLGTTQGYGIKSSTDCTCGYRL